MIRIKKIENPDDVWVHENFLSSNLHQGIKEYLNNYKNEKIDNYEGRILEHDSKKYKLKDTQEHRPYHKLWHLPYIPDFWNQTNDTIAEWSKNQYRQLMHPTVRLLMEQILTCSPFSDYDGDWIALSGMFNLLSPNTSLFPHKDASLYVTDITKYITYSATYYVDVSGEGGEFWDERGVFYKPNNNSLLINDGSWLHGVRACDSYRLGITFRFLKSTDIYLPGNLEDLLYKPVL